MAIINCPVCSKRISSAAKNCDHCKTVFSDDMDEEQQVRAGKNRRYLKNQRLQNYSFLFVMLFAAGAMVMYFGITEANEKLNSGGRIMLSLGFIGYVVARVMLLLHRRK